MSTLPTDLLPPQPAGLLRQLNDTDVVCPAGQRVGDAGVHCSVEQHVIDGRRNTESVAGFCMGAYTECPSWRAQRDWEDKRRVGDLLGSMRRSPGATKADRMARLAAAQEMLRSNKPEARAARRRLGLAEWVD